MFKAKLFLQRQAFTLDVELHLPSRGVSVLFGESGSGKTAVLRCIAGLEPNCRGHIQFNGDSWQDETRFVPAYQRPIAYVFQDASLFPHLSAKKNLEFAMRRAGTTVPGLSYAETVELLGIGHRLDRYPAQLSGGEQQRVAIARALLIHPRLLLMDEPLSSLDQARKQEILPYLETLKRELELPIVYVTHSPDEVARLADQLVVLDNGRVIASGAWQEALADPNFPIKLGEEAGVVLEAKITERDDQWQLAKGAFPGGELWFRDTGHELGSQVRIRVFARDISLALQAHQDTSIINVLESIIEDISNDEHSGMALVRLRVGDSRLIARLTRRSAAKLQLTPGKSVWAQIKSAAIVQ